MYITIYFGDKPLFLCDEISLEIQPFVHHDDAVFIDELDSHTVKTMIHEMQQEKVHAGVFYHTDLEALLKAFYKKFHLVVAAGGLLKNEKDEMLFIFRRGKWDLPKGKLDKKESLETCAVRELEEETGVKGAKLLEPLATTRHTYHEGTRFILKESHWFLMKADSRQEFNPQADEDITEVKWVPPVKLDGYLSNTFPAVKEVVKAALRRDGAGSKP